jgi:hypothetical protein
MTEYMEHEKDHFLGFLKRISALDLDVDSRSAIACSSLERKLRSSGRRRCGQLPSAGVVKLHEESIASESPFAQAASWL